LNHEANIAGREGKEFPPLRKGNLIEEAQSKDGRQIDSNSAPNAKQGLLTDESPRRMANAKENGVIMRRSIWSREKGCDFCCHSRLSTSPKVHIAVESVVLYINSRAESTKRCDDEYGECCKVVRRVLKDIGIAARQRNSKAFLKEERKRQEVIQPNRWTAPAHLLYFLLGKNMSVDAIFEARVRSAV